MKVTVKKPAPKKPARRSSDVTQEDVDNFLLECIGPLSVEAITIKAIEGREHLDADRIKGEVLMAGVLALNVVDANVRLKLLKSSQRILGTKSAARTYARRFGE